MTNLDLSRMSNQEILSLHAQTMHELLARGAVRSMNNPVADLAESLVAKALKGELVRKSSKSHDIIVKRPDQEPVRYEVKARRLTGQARDRQLSVIRHLESRGFDFLVGVLFDNHYTPVRAALIPWHVVKQLATYSASTNGWNLVLTDSVWQVDGVEDFLLPLD